MTLFGTDLFMILSMAMRYAYGRMTFAPTIVSDALKQAWKEFSTDEKNLFIRELGHNLKENDPGMDVDKQTWEELLQFMKENVDD